MFDTLSDKLNSVFKHLKGQGKLSEKNIADGLRDVRMALLEADVHYQVVKRLVADIKERALGQEVMGSLTPGQQVVKIVNESLTRLMGETHEGLNLSGEKPVAVMLVGLQGSGKTTTAGKLSVLLRKTGKQPYLVPADVYRPAASTADIAAGERSLAVRLELLDEAATLTDERIDGVVKAVVGRLQADLGARLRGH